MRNIPDQLTLARLMRRGNGTLTKKLQKPELIDVQWLAEFAVALDVRATDLFVDPRTLEAPPPAWRPRIDTLMRVAEKASDAQLDGLIAILSPAPSSQPHPEPPAAPQDQQRSKEPSA